MGKIRNKQQGKDFAHYGPRTSVCSVTSQKIRPLILTKLLEALTIAGVPIGASGADNLQGVALEIMHKNLL